MPWPKGKSRKPQTLKVETNEPHLSAPKSNRKRAPNWDSATDERYAKFGRKINWEPLEGEDRLHVDTADDIRRAGYALQWQPTSVLGDEKVCADLYAKAQRNGWVALDPYDFDLPIVEVDGLRLMARPLEIDAKAREHDRRKAIDAVALKQEALVNGEMGSITMPGGARHPSALRHNKINRTFEPVHIPQDE